MESYKQIKALEFVSCMEEFALEKQMKQRILDRIRELKGSLERELSDLEVEQKVLEVDELANYISKQFFKENQSEIIVDEMTTISIDEIKERIEAILQECHSGNESVKNGYINNQQSYIVEAAQKMRDFSNIKANYKEVQNSRFFCEKFEKIGMNLNHQISMSLLQFTKTVSLNCEQAVGKLRNMLSYIQDERFHKRQKEIYSFYDSKRSQIFQEHQTKISTIDCGGNEIGRFGTQHIEKVDSIIEEQKKKIFFTKLIPILIIATFIIVPKIGGWIGNQIETIVEANQESVPEEKTWINSMEDIGKYAADKAIEKVMDSEAVDSIGILVTVLIKIPLYVLAIIAYYIYVKIMDKVYVKRVCKSVGLYMTSEIEKFWQTNSLETKIAEAFRSQQESLEISYREIFEKLVNNKNVDNVQTLSEEDRFIKLREEWNDIKRLVE